MEWKKIEGTPGFEPGTSRSAVECSTTELYPHIYDAEIKISNLNKIISENLK